MLQERVRGRAQRRLAPVSERMLEGEVGRGPAEKLRSVVAGLGRQSRPLAAWTHSVQDDAFDGGSGSGRRIITLAIVLDCAELERSSALEPERVSPRQ